MYTLSSLTPRSIQIFLQKAGEWVGGIKDGNPESINSGRRNAIKAGLAGLLVVATATNAVNALAGEVDKGAWQVVETQFGNLSFAQIQKHPQRADILKSLRKDNREMKAQFDEWETQVAINDGDEAAKRTQVAINEWVRLEKEALAKMRTIVAAWWTLKKEYESLVLKYVSVPPPDKNALYIQEEAKKRQVFA